MADLGPGFSIEQPLYDLLLVVCLCGTLTLAIVALEVVYNLVAGGNRFKYARIQRSFG
jgi:hypothetical protein